MVLYSIFQNMQGHSTWLFSLISPDRNQTLMLLIKLKHRVYPNQSTVHNVQLRLSSVYKPFITALCRSGVVYKTDAVYWYFRLKIHYYVWNIHYHLQMDYTYYVLFIWSCNTNVIPKLTWQLDIALCARVHWKPEKVKNSALDRFQTTVLIGHWYWSSPKNFCNMF